MSTEAQTQQALLQLTERLVQSHLALQTEVQRQLAASEQQMERFQEAMQAQMEAAGAGQGF